MMRVPPLPRRGEFILQTLSTGSTQSGLPSFHPWPQAGVPPGRTHFSACEMWVPAMAVPTSMADQSNTQTGIHCQIPSSTTVDLRLALRAPLWQDKVLGIRKLGRSHHRDPTLCWRTAWATRPGAAMAAFTNLDWTRFDVWAIVAESGLAAVDEVYRDACRAWLGRQPRS